MNFESFEFHPRVAAGVAAAGYTTPTPIQQRAIPKIMQGNDVIGLAQTGTGKTAAFVLPMLHRLVQKPRKSKGLRGLIMAPTRELALQIHQAVMDLGSATGVKSVAVFGGVGIQKQIKALSRADIAVACPGRLLDHIQRRTVNLSAIDMLVLDEADQMFDMGFLPDIRRILSHLPAAGRQTLLFSATMPGPIRTLAEEILTRPRQIRVGHEAPVQTVSHAFYPVAHHQKTALLIELLGTARSGAVLVFTRTKHRARQLDSKLSKLGFRSASLQGNLSQVKRQKAMKGFKSGQIQILVATDIASRGIDVTQVSHVINFDMPSTPETYIHRIGRTGRAQRTGEAYTLVTDDDRRMMDAIHRTIGKTVERRTLAGFDYQPPSTTPRRQPPALNRRRSTWKYNRRQPNRTAKKNFAKASQQ